MKFASRYLSFDSPKIMGILNITPDSFSDGGRFVQSGAAASESVDVDACLRAAEKMHADGADIIDIGGESTRPGAEKVGSQQEQDRVLPVLEKIAANVDIVVSVDTSNAELIREAANLGAGLINDVRALEKDGALQAAAHTGLPVCLMHMQGNPKTMQDRPQYDSVVEDVSAYLDERVSACLAAGMGKDKIILDAGIGFGKSLEHNRSLLQSTETLLAKGFPVLVGASRKSLIGKVLGRENPSERLAGSLALAYDQFCRGVSIVRVHDVQETADALKMFQFLQQGLVK